MPKSQRTPLTCDTLVIQHASEFAHGSLTNIAALTRQVLIMLITLIGRRGPKEEPAADAAARRCGGAAEAGRRQRRARGPEAR